MKDALTKLMGSRKALIMLVAVIATGVLCAMGKVSQEQFFSFLKVTLPAWMASQAWEDSQLKPRATTDPPDQPSA